MKRGWEKEKERDLQCDDAEREEGWRREGVENQNKKRDDEEKWASLFVNTLIIYKNLPLVLIET